MVAHSSLARYELRRELLSGMMLTPAGAAAKPDHLVETIRNSPHFATAPQYDMWGAPTILQGPKARTRHMWRNMT